MADLQPARPAGTALVCRGPSGHRAMGWEGIARPPLGPQDVEIAVHVVGVNYLDTLIADGTYGGAAAESVPGCEAVGTITNIGSAVSAFQCGDRVAVFSMSGCCASSIVADSRSVFHVPAAIGEVTAATVPVSGMTAYYASHHGARLQGNEAVLVTGAAGATGTAVVQVCKALGATVIGCVGSAEKMGIVKAAGADAVATYDIDDMTAVVRALCASGVNVVIDTVGGSVLEKAMCLCAQRGRVCLVGATGGSTALANTMPILQQELSLRGVSLGAYLQRDQDAFAQDVAFLFSLLESEQLRSNVQTVLPFRDARVAFDLIRTRRNAGKTVLMAPATSR